MRRERRKINSLFYFSEQVEWAVRAIDFGFILQNILQMNCAQECLEGVSGMPARCRCVAADRRISCGVTRRLIPDRLTASRNIRAQMVVITVVAFESAIKCWVSPASILPILVGADGSAG